MCCFKSRKTPALIITILSVLVIIAGLAIAIIAFGAQAAESVLDSDYEEMQQFSTYKTGAFGVIAAAGIISILVGIMGLLFICIKHRCYALCFGTLLGGIWMWIVIMGGVLATASAVSDSVIVGFCDGNAQTSSGQQAGSTVASFDAEVNTFVNDLMCT